MLRVIERWRLPVACVFVWIFASFAMAQEYPTRPIHLIVVYAPGGSTDITARILAQKLTESLGQSVIVDDRGGAAGMVGSDVVAKAAPDGYTLAIVSASHTANPSLFSKLPYDTIKDFTPITLVDMLPEVLVAHPSAKIRSVAELLAVAKASPDSLSYGSSGNGGAAHLVGQMLNLSAAIHVVHVPYKGGGPAVMAVLGGEVPLLFNSIPPLLPYIQSGKVIPLAVASAKRSPLLPSVPTFVESGLPAVVLSEWAGILAPAHTPKVVVEKIHDAVVKALRIPEVTERLSALGAEPVGSTPEEFASFINVEITKLDKVVKAVGARIN